MPEVAISEIMGYVERIALDVATVRLRQKQNLKCTQLFKKEHLECEADTNKGKCTHHLHEKEHTVQMGKSSQSKSFMFHTNFLKIIL